LTFLWRVRIKALGQRWRAAGGRPYGVVFEHAIERTASGGGTTTANRCRRKELRPPSTGRSEIRILFCFDPWRSAILLIAGDKSGQWSRWYRDPVPEAEELNAAYLKERQKEIAE
jgi:hypothetical protein